jgi:ABC-type long-subunit fatty acid transport system fused permease/ATPase subunit
MHYLSLPLKNEIVVYMEVSFIIAVALATVVMLIVIGLFVALMYYRWRTSELMSGISDYIQKNWKMEQRIKQLERNTNHI